MNAFQIDIGLSGGRQPHRPEFAGETMDERRVRSKCLHLRQKNRHTHTNETNEPLG